MLAARMTKWISREGDKIKRERESENERERERMNTIVYSRSMNGRPVQKRKMRVSVCSSANFFQFAFPG